MKWLTIGVGTLTSSVIFAVVAYSGDDQGNPPQSPADFATWLDSHFGKEWQDTDVGPVPIADDATYLCRVYLDIVGTIPSVAQARDFLEDRSPDKRRQLVEKLVADPRCAQHMARTWRRIMVPRSSPQAEMGPMLDPWLQEQFAKNVPYDELARKVVTASGDLGRGTPVAFYAAVGNKPEHLADAVSRVFLGVRIGCAQCHNHPFASWKKEDFWGMAAFFAGTSSDDQLEAKVLDRNLASIKPADSEQEYVARFLDGELAEIPKSTSPREVLAQWMTSTSNANFTETAVNRIWQHFFGRGLVEPVDELDQLPPGKRPAVLQEMAARFGAAGFDLRWLIEGISQSELYQRASDSAVAGEDVDVVRHVALKTLTPEQVFDALEQALALPVSRSNGAPRHDGQRDLLIARLNESFAETPEEYRAGIPQTLMLMNGQLMASGTGFEESRTLRSVVEAPFLTPTQKIETLYLATLTRPPRTNEIDFFLQIVTRERDEAKRRRIYADIFWALLNSPEFVLNH